MASHVRDRAELELELREQAAALRASAAAYDDGALWEAKRLATVAYVLLHEGGKNARSLLGQLGLKGDMLSSADDGRGNSLMPLANVSGNFIEGGITFTPFLATKPELWHRLSFKKWYKEPIFTNGRLRLTRMNLICTFRSKAGGAHSDSHIDDDAFRWLQKDSPIYVSSTTTARDAAGNEIEIPPELAGKWEDPGGPVPNGHFASMRQIAWEIELALHELGV